MVGKLCKAITVGLGAALACSIAAPAWSSDCQDKSDDKLLGVLSNFDNCVFHDQSNDDDDAGSGPLEYLENLSPGKWRSFARYNFIDKTYSYRNSGPNKNDETDYSSLTVTGNRRGGTFNLSDIDKLSSSYSEFAVSLIRNKKIGGEFDEDLTNNDYVLYTFDIEDLKKPDGPMEWNSTQFGLNKNDKYRKVTDFKIFVKRIPHDPGPKSVPEPMSVLGLVVSGGVATVLKRKIKGND
jgi:hypothetical protein